MHTGVHVDESVAKVSVVGVGMLCSGVAAQMFEALSKSGINIDMISTSEIKISVAGAREDGVDAAAAAIHEQLLLG